MDFLRTILVELDNIKKEDYIEPLLEKEPCDIEVGIASDYIKKLYTLFRQKEKIHDLMEVEYKHLSVADRIEKYPKLSELTWTCDILRDIISMAIRYEFNIWDKYFINLINQFRVVYKESRPGGDFHVIPIHFPL